MRRGSLDLLTTAASGQSDAASLAGLVARAGAFREALGLSEDESAWRVLGPAAEAAALNGDADKLAVISGIWGDRFPDKRAHLQRTLEGTLAARRNADAAAMEERIRATADGGAPYSVVADLIAGARGGTISHETADRLDRTYLATAQAATENTLRTRILAGTINRDDVAGEVIRAAQLKPDDPNFIDPQTGAAILNSATQRERFDLAKAQTVSILNGGPGNLTEAQHGSAVAEVLGPEGSGYIDAANRIAQPAPLADALFRARFVPKSVAQTLFANLTSDDPTENANAALAIGKLGAGSSRLYADLLDAAGPSVDPLITAAVDQYARGRLQNADTAARAVADIRAARDAAQEVPRPSPEVVADIRRDGKIDPTATLSKQAASIVDEVRESLPHTKNYSALGGFDWLWADPTLSAADHNIERRVETWLASRFETLRTRLPRDKAMEESRKYAAAQVRNSIDFVRWNGLVTPIAIDVGEGLRMPESMRWGAGFEDEARAEVKAVGFDPESIVTMRPYLDPATATGAAPVMGWAYITGDGDALRDDKGRLILFRPSDKTAAGNDAMRRELDRRESDFIRRQEFGRTYRPDTGLSVPTSAPLDSRFNVKDPYAAFAR